VIYRGRGVNAIEEIRQLPPHIAERRRIQNAFRQSGCGDIRRRLVADLERRHQTIDAGSSSVCSSAPLPTGPVDVPVAGMPVNYVPGSPCSTELSSGGLTNDTDLDFDAGSPSWLDAVRSLLSDGTFAETACSPPPPPVCYNRSIQTDHSSHPDVTCVPKKEKQLNLLLSPQV